VPFAMTALLTARDAQEAKDPDKSAVLWHSWRHLTPLMVKIPAEGIQ